MIRLPFKETLNQVGLTTKANMIHTLPDNAKFWLAALHSDAAFAEFWKQHAAAARRDARRSAREGFAESASYAFAHANRCDSRRAIWRNFTASTRAGYRNAIRLGL